MTSLPSWPAAPAPIGRAQGAEPRAAPGLHAPGHYYPARTPGQAGHRRALAHMPAGKRLDFKTYKVRKGDTLAKVARRFKLTPRTSSRPTT